MLYAFTPQCPWCARNLDNLKSFAQAEQGHYRILGLSLTEDGLADYVAKNHLEFPIYSDISAETRKAYKLSGTPETIVISPDGKVLAVWVGAWTGKQQTEIESYFHIKLPGLRDLKNTLPQGSSAPQGTP